jgi:hypothetical protein
MGGLISKTDLLRIFWRAHLIYADVQPGYLSFWPLLKTAAGPAIQDVDRLLGELVADGTLAIDETSTGGVSSLRLEPTDQCAAGEALPADAVEAIQQAVALRDAPPNLAQDYAALRSWNEAVEGEELNIYLDVIPAGEYAERKQRLEDMASVLNDHWQ